MNFDICLALAVASSWFSTLKRDHGYSVTAELLTFWVKLEDISMASFVLPNESTAEKHTHSLPQSSREVKAVGITESLSEP